MRRKRSHPYSRDLTSLGASRGMGRRPAISLWIASGGGISSIDTLSEVEIDHHARVVVHMGLSVGSGEDPALAEEPARSGRNDALEEPLVACRQFQPMDVRVGISITNDVHAAAVRLPLDRHVAGVQRWELRGLACVHGIERPCQFRVVRDDEPTIRRNSVADAPEVDTLPADRSWCRACQFLDVEAALTALLSPREDDAAAVREEARPRVALDRAGCDDALLARPRRHQDQLLRRGVEDTLQRPASVG